VVMDRLVLRIILDVTMPTSLCIVALISCALIDIRRRIGRTEYGGVGQAQWQRRALRLRHLRWTGSYSAMATHCRSSVINLGALVPGLLQLIGF
jgi:hypothetical protein